MLSMPESLKDQPITFGLLAATVVFILGVVGWANINFVSRAEAEENNKTLTEKIDAIGTQVNVSTAFQMERGFQEDLNKHNEEKPVPITSRWLETQRDLTAKRNLASRYKDCVLAESKNCDLMQKQLWQ